MTAIPPTLSSLPFAFEITPTLPGRTPGPSPPPAPCLSCMGLYTRPWLKHRAQTALRAGTLGSLLSPLAPPAGLPRGGQHVHNKARCYSDRVPTPKTFLGDEDPGPRPAHPQWCCHPSPHCKLRGYNQAMYIVMAQADLTSPREDVLTG